MSTKLEIRDGDPHWWNSPDIWVVPGTDPEGTPGQPVAGEQAYVWGRVHNKGEQAVSGAKVKFYWSNPATGVLRSNSTLIGSAFVDLDVGESKEVLCLIPWIPEIVNDGHECIVAEIIHSDDPLPSPLPDQFNPPEYDQIAQKNLTVLEMTENMMMMPIQVGAPNREERQVIIETEFGGELDEKSLMQLGLKDYKPAKGSEIRAGLSFERDCQDSRESFLDQVRMTVDPGTKKAVYLKVMPHEIECNSYVLLHVVSKNGGEIDGGITYILINKREG